MKQPPFMAQVPEEFERLLEHAKGKKLILEIGTCQGGTLYHFMQVADDNAVFVSIDMPGGRFGGELGQPEPEEMNSWLKPNQKLHILRGDSHDPFVKREVREIIKRRYFDFAFIDGDHTYEGVKQDYEMYQTMVRGVIAFHDILHHPNHPDVGVDRFWKELTGDKLEYIKDPAQGWAGIGVLQK